ncbi:OLC1v1017479C1 [Oldenlandia corymbosa var. corymbosa]|uniref:OLC1v1017479C1 n=1 Tax=Oldenlandia corymbosa var. corymbosa TaxID=529605 RepID=A0AAV1E9J5_OLDCO|nr:OLC1v1017479C1 [Oldenlandia corymbosa var. corymbosa]
MFAALSKRFCSATNSTTNLNPGSIPASVPVVPASAQVSKLVPPIRGSIPNEYFGKIDLYLHRTLTGCKIVSIFGGLVGAGILAYVGYPLWKVKAAEFQKMSDLRVYEKERELEAMEINVATQETYLEYIAKKLNKQDKVAPASPPPTPAA